MMKIRKLAIVPTVFVLGIVSDASEDEFSRANCWNNESLTFSLFDPPEWRAVFSWHFQFGYRKHYVTENPPDTASCYVGAGGYHQVNGLFCLHLFTEGKRHAAVHGDFFSSEPNPDGNLTPGISTSWSTVGVHYTVIPGVGAPTTFTQATDCNLRFDQFY